MKIDGKFVVQFNKSGAKEYSEKLFHHMKAFKNPGGIQKAFLSDVSVTSYEPSNLKVRQYFMQRRIVFHTNNGALGHSGFRSKP